MTIEYLIYNNNLIRHHPNVSTNILIKYINMGIYVSNFVTAYYNVCKDALQHNISISHTYQYNNLEPFEKTIPFCHIKILTFLHNILFPNIPSLNFINPYSYQLVKCPNLNTYQLSSNKSIHPKQYTNYSLTPISTCKQLTTSTTTSPTINYTHTTTNKNISQSFSTQYHKYFIANIIITFSKPLHG